MPLTHFLKHYFKDNHKLGSRDRKILSEMTYSWYRCEKGIVNREMPFEQKVQGCLFLCSDYAKYLLSFIPEQWGIVPGASVAERISALEQQGIAFNIEHLFEGGGILSEGIEKNQWLGSMLTQPQLFIRIRKPKEQITSSLAQQNISYTFINDKCIALPNGAAIDKVLPEDAYVVQDVSSQETGSYFHAQKGEQWYDACSGAGGKSLLLSDSNNEIKLTATDKRERIVSNLKQRFRQYHLPMPETHIVDVADKGELFKVMGGKQFDGIICDVPCSGSGTWARTPEQLYFFDENKFKSFPPLQQRIATNAVAYLKPGGRLVYITCSIFKDENENVIKQIMDTTGLQLEQSKLINGIDIKADSMFVAVLKRF